MSGGLLTSLRRSSAAVSPVRTPTLHVADAATPSRWAACRTPVSGDRRFRSMSTASALSGETYSTRQRSRGSSGGRPGDQPVDRPQERRERLARAGRGHHQRVVPVADGGPGLRLGRGRLGERGHEPFPDRRGETVERRAQERDSRGHVTILPAASDTLLALAPGRYSAAFPPRSRAPSSRLIARQAAPQPSAGPGRRRWPRRARMPGPASQRSVILNLRPPQSEPHFTDYGWQGAGPLPGTARDRCGSGRR